MDDQAAELWKSVRPLLGSLAARIESDHPEVTSSVGVSSNDAYLFRAYVTFTVQSSPDEIAVTVDAALEEEHVVLEADLCSDSGELLATGPVARLPAPSRAQSWEAARSWVEQLSAFLIAIEPLVSRRIRKL